jgi:hypothetical protein
MPFSGRLPFFRLGEALLELIEQAAGAHDLEQERRHRRTAQGLATRGETQRAARKIDFDRGARRDAVDRVAFERRQAQVDGVAVKEAGEGARQHRGNAEVLQRLRRLLARGTAAEVASGDDDVAVAHLAGERRVDRFEAMARQFVDAGCHPPARGERIGIDVVAEQPGAPAQCTSSRGSAIRPATALAATVYGEAR